jgi:hypothetical protein
MHHLLERECDKADFCSASKLLVATAGAWRETATDHFESLFFHMEVLANLHGPAGLARALERGEFGSGTGRRRSTFRFGRRRKDIPKAQGFVGRRRDDRTRRTARHVQDTTRVALQVLDLGHAGILPQAELIPRKSVRRQNLLFVRIPL